MNTSLSLENAPCFRSHLDAEINYFDDVVISQSQKASFKEQKHVNEVLFK